MDVQVTKEAFSSQKKENIQHLQRMKFLNFFLLLWIRIPNTDPDPLTQLNPEPNPDPQPCIKVLKHTATGKVRLLMRRDQVLKICVNHYVTPALVAGFKEKDSKSLTWAAQDYSDGELTGMTFALRLVSLNLPKALSVFYSVPLSILPCLPIVSSFFFL
jgi:hypothetical protein